MAWLQQSKISTVRVEQHQLQKPYTAKTFCASNRLLWKFIFFFNMEAASHTQAEDWLLRHYFEKLPPFTEW